MKRYVILLVGVSIILTVFAVSSSAEIKFKDLPDDHWAASAVYDLVRMGVTKGYPDGTFRGNKKISRYETAVFLAKLAEAIGAEDIKADIKAIRDEIVALKTGGGGTIAGSYQADWLIGNLLATAGASRGAVANYRLKLSSIRDLGDGATVKINLDTMDYGWGSTGGGDLATNLLDIESNLKLDLSSLGLENLVDLKLTYGPGSRQHTDASGILPSEDGVIIKRPNTAIMAATSLWGADVSGGYIVKTHDDSGKVNFSMITGTVGMAFEGVPLLNTLRIDTTGDYLSSGMFSSATRDMRATIALAAPLAERVDASGTLGLAGSASRSIMLAGKVALNDLWDTGTVATINVAKVGSKFISTNPTFAGVERDLAGLDTFNKPLENATVNIGGEIVQEVSEDVKLIGKGELRLSGDYKYTTTKGRLTAQGGVSYVIAPNTNLDAMYRVYQDKSTGDTSDVAALGLLYNF